jgi:hypothetical protein
MGTIRAVVLLVVLALFTSALAACSGGFDPDKLDFLGLNEKKKLPGERKEVFPGGVPGVTQGIPPEYVKGNQPPDAALATSAEQGKEAGKEAAAAEPDKKAAAEGPEKPKPKPKRVAKPRTVPQPTQVTVSPAQQQPAPWPDSQPAQQQGQSPWPTQAQTQSQTQGQTQGQTSATTPWPSSPQPGTFSR